MDKKTYSLILSILLSAFALFAISAQEGFAQSYTLTVINTGAGHGTVKSNPSGINCGPGQTCTGTFSDGKKVTLKAKPNQDSSFAGWAGGGCIGIKTCSVIMDSDLTITATFDLKTPEMSLSTDELDFSGSESGKKVKQTLVISNIGTGNLIVTVSGLEGTDFSISGKSTFVIKPNKSYNLRVTYAPSASAALATDGLGTDERMSGSGVSDRGASSESEDIEASQGIPLGSDAPTTMVLHTNDPKHPEASVELAPLVPLVPIAPDAVIEFKSLLNYGGCADATTGVEETGEFQISFEYLTDKGYFTIICGSDTCKGVTTASGNFKCPGGCTFVYSQATLQYIIYGKLSKDKSTLTLDIFHGSEPPGTITVTCPNIPTQVTPFQYHTENFMFPRVEMPFVQGAKDTFGGAGYQQTITLSIISK
jgi:hypothetical protein